jgi:hypothetical protein
MDSQITLVSVAPAARLMFSRNSMKNATLFLDSGPAYTISTDISKAHTELRAAGTGELLARIAQKEILPDTITFPVLNGGKEIRLTKWLKKSKLSDGWCAMLLFPALRQSSQCNIVQPMLSKPNTGISC